MQMLPHLFEYQPWFARLNIDSEKGDRVVYHKTLDAKLYLII